MEKAGQRLQSAGRSQSGPQRLDQHHLKRGSVGPVAWPLRIRAVGGVDRARFRHVPNRPLHDAPGKGRFPLRDRQRPRHKTGMADLVPVEVTVHPGVRPLGGIQRWQQGVSDDRLCDTVPLPRCQRVIKPVKTDPGGKRGLPDIEKVRGSPLGKIGKPQQLLTRPLPAEFVSREPILPGESQNPSLNLPNGVHQKTGRGIDEVARRQLALGIVFEERPKLKAHRIVLFFDRIDPGGVRKEPWMRREPVPVGLGEGGKCGCGAGHWG